MNKQFKKNLIEITPEDNLMENGHLHTRDNLAPDTSSFLSLVLQKWRFSPATWFAELINMQTWRKEPLKNATTSMVFLCIICSVLAILFLLMEAYSINKIVQTPEFPGNPLPATVQKPEVTNRNNNNIFASRPFFHSEKTAGNAFSAPVNAATVLGLAQRYTLLGIISGPNPQAIVRENSGNSSLFLTTGNRIGDYIIKEIHSDKVILIRDGEKVELTL
ncbi:MAG: hypothetical protein DWQ05_07700 [Calditrichaeota bacterium]|nr:MAG: hypothetical protein DWQ05_07700 [Calditrichota bacterium]